MRFVDADYLIALGNEDGANGFVSVEDINDAPTIFTTPVAVKAWMNKADLVEVVRCKDCKWWTKQKASLQGRCDAYGMYPTGEWYCARGERKENATD